MSTTRNAFLTTFKHITRPAPTSSANATARVPRVTKPIVSAPMNGWSGPNLVATVANHGGFPIYPIGYYTDPSKILKDLQSIPPLLNDPESDNDGQQDTDVFMPYAVGFISFWLDLKGPELLRSILKGQGDHPDRRSAPRPPAAIWFAFGDYKPFLEFVREYGAVGTKIFVQVQTVQEALEAQEQGVDVVVLQGTEAGGHGAQRVSPLMTLLPETVQALKDKVASNSSLQMPVVLAAGGISTAAQVTAVQAMGASGVVVGTGFMPTFESHGAQHAKERLLRTSDGGANTVRTRIFDELREFDYPAGYDGRVVRNLLTDREEDDLKYCGLYEQKGQAAFKLLKGDRTGTKQDYERAVKEQDYDLLPLWCGTGVGMLNKQVSAAEFMDQLMVNQQQ
ncbi:2-nitropropane dioxygenase [Gamsiella multidivaricata]|uniref:2-nitropropane dioxygenase n=1 Tax=Gamsiella multidivaricata TaxID=101098 RepID=UPI002220BEAA|nr:2-nitropropane dioxygenase [Gamsiella multidivaricata]KAG0368718.1 hypothetical protein BGZ54_001306 [Gamsiella multidivaricata]KAI7826540.1 2-nitropropane dioxygenase [Gamsiella multidivaricata]